MAKSPSEIKVKVSISELVGNVENLKEIKAKKNGEITINELLRILLNELNNNEIEDLAVVRTYKDGSVSSGWTAINSTIGLGMVETLKIHMANSMD